jgi:hypothetical protein
MTLTQTLSTAQAAARLGRSPITLRSWRHKGVGPRWFKASPRRVFYREEDVATWAANEKEATQ